MRRFFTILLIMFVALGCKKDDAERFSSNEITLRSDTELSDSDFNRVLFGYEAGEEVTLTVAMMEDWSIVVKSDLGETEAAWGFSLSTMSGKANTYEELTIKSTATNNTQYLNVLGCVYIYSSTSGEILFSFNVEQSRKPAAQTTLTYFAGTSLNSYFLQNIADAKLSIETGILGDSGRYLYLLPSSKYKANLVEITLSNGTCVETIIEEYADLQTLTSGSLSRVLERVKDYIDFDSKVDVNEQRLNLVMSGHGTGWILSSLGQLSTAAGVGDYVSEWEAINPAIQTRYIGCSTDGFADISEITAEFAAADVHFGYILFDMCFMSSVEMLYRMKDYTDYIVASPCEVMGAGFPYEYVMPYMFSNDGADYDLQGICESYINFYENYTYPYGCVAVCVTSELEALAAAQKSLGLRTLSTEEVNALQSYEGRTDDHIFFDLQQYVNVAADGSDAELLSAYNTQYNKAFPEACRLHTEYFYTNIDGSNGSTGKTYVGFYSGVTTSAPTPSKYATTWEYEWWAQATTAE